MRHAASLRLETAATHGSAFAVSKSALSIHSYVDMGGVGPPSEKNRFSASTASADEPNTHFVHSVADFNNLENVDWHKCRNSANIAPEAVFGDRIARVSRRLLPVFDMYTSVDLFLPILTTRTALFYSYVPAPQNPSY